MQLSLDSTQFRTPFGGQQRPGTRPEDILLCALRNGIRAFDTASAYDEAEMILGNYLDQYEDFGVSFTTKIRPNALYSLQPSEYAASLRQNLQSSLRSLCTSRVHACLFHNAEQLDNEPALAALYQLKEEELTEKVGVCVSDVQQFERADRSPYIDVIQIPYNVFDTRLDEALAQTTKEIQARGVFLKGLILMDEQDVPRQLSDVKPYLHTLGSYCERQGVSRAELALTFVKTQPKISTVILAVDDVAQLDEDCRAFAREGDNVALRELTEQLGGLDERIIQPSLWNGEFR